MVTETTRVIADALGDGSVEQRNTLIAAATYMLELDIALFSKKQKDDGGWWVMLYQPTLCDPIGKSGPIPAEARVRGDGWTVAEATVDALHKLGAGGLRWKLWALEVRLQQLSAAFGFPDEPKRGNKVERACRHGVTGARCRKCV